MPEKFFTLKQEGSKCSLITPDNKPFFTMGLNHLDSTVLHQPENQHIWEGRFKNSQEKWLKEQVAPDLQDWGFNTLGWAQEVIVRGPTDSTCHRHSRNFTYEEYQWLDINYCHMLSFTGLHQWDVETKYPDVFSDEFEEWCDYVARSECVRFKDDPKLIGYFYTDCPTFAHDSIPHPNMKKAWFDPEKIKSDSSYREKFKRTAIRYYKVLHDSIRRYDQNHLIFGDRYEATPWIPDELFEAATPYVDVFGFQYFKDIDVICERFDGIHQQTGKPILLADASIPRKKDPGAHEQYPVFLKELSEMDCCIGWHYCGAYLTNPVRQYGLRLADNSRNEPLVSTMAKANHELHERIGSGR